MLVQFNSDGTVSLLAHLERRWAEESANSKPMNRMDHSQMDAWVAQDFWGLRNRKATR